MSAKDKPYFADHYNYVFLFHKKWSGDSYTDVEWSEILSEADQIYNNFGGKDNPHVLEMLCAALEEIERHCGHENMWGTKKFLEAKLRNVCKVSNNKELAKVLEDGN